MLVECSKWHMDTGEKEDMEGIDTFYWFATTEEELLTKNPFHSLYVGKSSDSQPSRDIKHNDFVKKDWLSLPLFTLPSPKQGDPPGMWHISNMAAQWSKQISCSERDAACLQERLFCMLSKYKKWQTKELMCKRWCGESSSSKKEWQAWEWKRGNMRDQESDKEKKINI